MRIALFPLGVLLSACASVAPPTAISIVSEPGPLPLRAEFETRSPRQLLLVSGSAWAARTEDVRLEVQVIVDGGVVGAGRLFSNASSTHRTLVFPAVPTSLGPGRHVLELRTGNADTTTDPEDRFEATLLER